MANDIYDLEGTKSKVQMMRLMLELKLEVAVLRDLLDRHGIISALEFDSAKQYLASTPEYKDAFDSLDAVASQATRFQQNPDEYLRYIMNQKLRGKL